jgi:hypothetical protein
MPWLSLITSILGIVSGLIGWLNSRQLLAAGADQEIARQLAAILAMTRRGQAIYDEVHHMDDAQLNSFLKALGRD